MLECKLNLFSATIQLFSGYRIDSATESLELLKLSFNIPLTCVIVIQNKEILIKFDFSGIIYNLHLFVFYHLRFILKKKILQSFYMM